MPFSPFPSQKKSFTQKTPEFFKECVDTAIQIVDYTDDLGIRASMLEKRINYDLINNILDPNDVDRIVNPWRMANSEFPVELRNYPLIKPKLDLLTGEEIMRRFDWKVVLKNADAVSSKEDTAKEEFWEYVKGIITNQSQPDPQKVKAQLQKMDQWRTYELQDFRETMGTQILNYYYYTYKYKYMFNRGFWDALTAGEEIYSVPILNGEVRVRKENPLNVITFGISDSNYVEDAQIIVIDGYRSLGQIIDDYHESLKPEDLKTLEDGSYISRSPEAGLSSYLTVPENYYEEALGEQIFIMPNNTLINAYAGGFDTLGNIRETRVYWRSLRKIGVLKYFDEYGIEQKKFVDENYPIDEEAGEDVKWEWVNEWLQGVRLATDIFVDLKPVPRVNKSMSNPSECLAPVIGTIYNINNNTAMSLVSYAKPYQYLYNAIMYNNEMAIIKNRGVVPRLPIHLMPDWMEIEDWIYYFNILGFAVEDAFRESSKGVAEGKLAGNFQNSTQPINASNVDYIKENLLMLNLIKQHVDEITGVSPQRQGQIENRESVGGVERAVTQSSHITENWFSLHDNTKLRVMEAVLDFTRVAWKGKKFQRQFVMDDMTQALLDFDAEVYSSSQYGIYISDASSDTELFNSLKQVAGMALQAGKLKFSDLMSIYMSDSAISIRRKIQDSEERADEAIQQQQEAAKQQPPDPMTEVKSQEIMKKLDLLQQEIDRKKDKDKSDASLKDKELALKEHVGANGGSKK